ncbi:hypothetical protein [Thermus hydrothermalis]|uniref:hypothetical protein n=1 Tax=Thermus hydrothermalis TaxID=2908148 RepID=UPI001FAAC27F|nr:hypothetical protein [Thermus hydrothermalis]
MRPFRELLREALEALASGEPSLGEAFRKEALAQARLGPSGEDPVARALALGRRALVALAEGDRKGAHRHLQKAVESYPGLGGGLALELLVRLGEEEGLEVEPYRALREREHRAWEEAPWGLRLLKALSEVPAPFWRPFLEDGAGERPRGAERRPPSPRRRREPIRPTLRLPLRHRPEGGEGREGAVRSLQMLRQMDFLPSTPPRPGTWRSEGDTLHLDEGGRLTVRLDRLRAWGGLLALVGSRGRVLVPLPWEEAGPRYRLHIPLPGRPGEDLEAWVWTWEHLTPETLEALLEDRKTFYSRELLAAWLLEAFMRGQADPGEWVRVLYLLGNGEP